MARGLSARQAVDAAAAGATGPAWRQLAAIDAAGNTASFTGDIVYRPRADAHGQDCVAIGNIIRSEAVPGAMVRAFEADPDLPLAERLVRAIVAGEEAGGEIAAVASAALLVVHRESFPYVDLRVDSNAAPLDELARLWRAYAPVADDFVLRALAPDEAAVYRPPPPKP
jgi:uncharacterized Ntn-hydrolase superfamily protein